MAVVEKVPTPDCVTCGVREPEEEALPPPPPRLAVGVLLGVCRVLALPPAALEGLMRGVPVPVPVPLAPPMMLTEALEEALPPAAAKFALADTVSVLMGEGEGEEERLLDTVCVTVAEMLGGALPLPALVLVGLAVMLPPPPALPALTEALGEALRAGEEVALPIVCVASAVREAVPPRYREGELETLEQGVLDCVARAVTLAVSSGEELDEGKRGVAVRVMAREALGEPDALAGREGAPVTEPEVLPRRVGVPPPFPPMGEAEGDPDAVLAMLAVRLLLPLRPTLPLLRTLAVALTVALAWGAEGDTTGEADARLLAVPLPARLLSVGDCDTVRLALAVTVTVAQIVEEREEVELAWAVRLPPCAELPLALPLGLPEALPQEERLGEALGEEETLALSVEFTAVALPLSVCVAVPGGEGVMVPEMVPVVLPDMGALAVSVACAEALAVLSALAEMLELTVTVALTAAVELMLTLPVPLALPVLPLLALVVLEELRVELALTVLVALPVLVGVALKLTVPVALAVGLTVPVAHPVYVPLAV